MRHWPATATATTTNGDAGASAGGLGTAAWLRGIFEQTAIGIGVLDRVGVTVACNSAMARMLGRDATGVVGRRMADFTDPRDVERCERIMKRAFAGELDRFQVTKRYVRPDGSVVWGRLTAAGLRDDDGQVQHVVGMVEDFTARRRTEGALAHQARHDPLTGLPNRLHLECALEEALCRSRGPRAGQVGVLVVNVDDFDTVNGALGHVAGDALLRQVGCRIAAAIGDDALVARFTGDEFVVVREGLTGGDELAVLADHVRARLVEPYALAGGRRVHLSATFGLTTGDGRTATADSLLRDADIAVHEGKTCGRGTIQWFDDALRRQVLGEAALLADLHDAVEHDQLYLVYQPVVRLADGAVIAAEALLRWDHPTLGPVPPSRFLPAIEGTALLSRITWWVAKTAAHQAAEWRRQSGLPVAVSVNVPAPVLLEADLVVTLQQVLDEAALPASGLVLELTEHVLVDDGPATRLTLERLREMGVHLYIDDFGTGWSSLSYIKRLPVHGLKIDQSFVHGLPDDAGDASIVTAITAMAHGLGLDTVAEGVETSAQLDVLRSLGVAYAQGFFLGRPARPGDLPAGIWGGSLSSRPATG